MELNCCCLDHKNSKNSRDPLVLASGFAVLDGDDDEHGHGT